MHLRIGMVWLAAAGFCALGLAGGAQAVPIIEVEFTNTTGTGVTGSTFIDAENGDLLTAAIFVTPDAAGIRDYNISLRFDSVLDDELNLVPYLINEEFLPEGFVANATPGIDSTQESNTSHPGGVFGFEAQGGTGTGSGRFAIGEIVFQVGDVSTDGFDFTPILNSMTDLDGNAVTFATTKRGGVNALPEPPMLLLLGITCAGIATFGPQRSQSRHSSVNR